MYAFMEFIGALIPVFFLSRLALWLLRTMRPGIARILLAHAGSYGVAVTISAFGHADGGPWQWGFALSAVVLPQAFWLAADIFRHYRPVKPRTAEEQQIADLRQTTATPNNG